MSFVEFDKWAEENGYDATYVAGVGYLNKATENAHAGWQAYKDQVEDIIYEYGICKLCLTHFVPVKNIGPEKYAMECNCSVDRFRHTKIMQLQGINNEGEKIV